jgi:hypothetical protein
VKALLFKRWNPGYGQKGFRACGAGDRRYPNYSSANLNPIIITLNVLSYIHGPRRWKNTFFSTSNGTLKITTTSCNEQTPQTTDSSASSSLRLCVKNLYA